MRGQALLRVCQWQDASADFSRVLAIEADDVLALVCRAGAFNEMAEYDRAIGDCSRGIALQPNAPMLALAFVLRGHSYLRKNDYARAIDDYSECLRLDPKWETAYAERAQCYRALGDVPHALEDERQAAALRV